MAADGGLLAKYRELMDLDFYAAPGPLTRLTTVQAELIRRLDLDPVGLCHAAQGLLVSPSDAAAAGLSEVRMAERNTRPAEALLQRSVDLDSLTPLNQPRPITGEWWVRAGTMPLLATAFLRAADVPARARCGFATYFVPPQKVDHWIVEYWSHEERRWIRIDPEYVNLETPHPSRPRRSSLRRVPHCR